MEKKKIIIIGCGCRGTGYAKFIKDCAQDKAVIVAVAEPRDFYRNQIGDWFNLPEDRRFRDWREVAQLPKFADAVIIATQDAMHEAPAVTFADLKYDMLLEKPMAPTQEACERIVDAVRRNNVMFAVCHVLRYTPYTQKTIELVRSGKIGDVITVEHMESVGYWHQAHSFVRGNWRNSAESSSMLLQKSCHDLDWLRYIMNVPCKRVHSFGSLRYFRKENQPAGAADRCLDCPAEIESTCPYSARQIYLNKRSAHGNFGWPVDILTPEKNLKAVTDALQNGPYGRCVFACDNDVVDHQVVNMEFEGGRTACFTMTAFTPGGRSRRTRICGTRGWIESNDDGLFLYDFLADKETKCDLSLHNGSDINDGHGGGDGGLMTAFIHALTSGDASYILSGREESLESHKMVFGAEESRRTGKIVEI